VHDGHANIGDAQVLLPEGTDSQEAAVFYARPHEIDILRESPGASAIAAKVYDIRPLGATVWVELERENGQGIIEVELSRDRLNTLEIKRGEAVYLHPKRLKVFDEAISKRSVGH
jgi:sulfate transport system ATP-binding protein